MQAIAMLVHADDYLTMTPKQRCDARRERKRKLSALSFVHEVVEVPVDKTQRVELPIIPEPEPTSEVDLIPAWVERQKKNHIQWFSIAEICEWAKRRNYKPWFSIEEEIHPNGKKKICISEIQRACANLYGVTVTDIISARRTADVVLPRQVASYLAKKLTLCSLPEIGRRFGGRDHTTILHGVRKMAHMIQIDPEMADEIEYLKQGLCA